MAGDLDIVITRTFSAPRELVWRAWTETAHIEQWWGPEGFTTRVEKNEFRPGGRSRYVMTGPDGTEYPVGGRILEIVPFEKIVSTDEFEEGFEAPDSGALPEAAVTTITFDEQGGKTLLTLHIRHANAEDKRRHEEMGVVAGWQSSFDCLEEYLPHVKA